ncbi:hypothetical protein FD755_019465 [Muntiacus reevesi]|uniref:Uncharacterized protein n=1 Tax=Muntiacus reevesi TaxID=9886 RepID=A0A5N3X5L0_MUNRE|nr:hypothetical protein FD755_019465 [Muntiacus reevesi]
MPGVTVKDVKPQECVRTPAAVLRGSGKLKVPECVDAVKLAKHKELAAYNEKCTRTSGLALGLALKPRSVGSGGSIREWCHASYFCRGSKGVVHGVLQALEGWWNRTKTGAAN